MRRVTANLMMYSRLSDSVSSGTRARMLAIPACRWGDADRMDGGGATIHGWQCVEPPTASIETDSYSRAFDASSSQALPGYGALELLRSSEGGANPRFRVAGFRRRRSGLPIRASLATAFSSRFPS